MHFWKSVATSGWIWYGVSIRGKQKWIQNEMQSLRINFWILLLSFQDNLSPCTKFSKAFCCILRPSLFKAGFEEYNAFVPLTASGHLWPKPGNHSRKKSQLNQCVKTLLWGFRSRFPSLVLTECFPVCSVACEIWGENLRRRFRGTFRGTSEEESSSSKNPSTTCFWLN